MSRNWFGSVMPGWGRQSRAVGAHGKMESNSSTGQQPGSLKLAMRVCQPLPVGAVAAPATV